MGSKEMNPDALETFVTLKKVTVGTSVVSLVGVVLQKKKKKQKTTQKSPGSPFLDPQ